MKNLAKVDDAINILKKFKKNSREHAKVIYDILKSINEIYIFFENEYSILASRMFFYIDKNMFTLALTN